ncbi:MAG: hypothetical protein GWP59_01810 [Chlamydiales bacterium]|nr:hypothetical protein [Chlamydiales bacterium]NCF70414.1 hypothetical protein [Chlamydiales bacterium]
MTSSPKKGIIRGATVLGSVFLGKDGVVKATEENSVNDEEKKSLKALEEFWFQKGLRTGEESGYKKGWKEGDTKGYVRGLEEGKKQGLDEGKKQGFDEGKNSIQEEEEGEAEKQLLLLQEISTEYQLKLERSFEQVKPELIELCLKVCQKVIHDELKDPQALSKIVDAVLEKGRKLAGSSSVDIYFSDQDFEALGPTLGKIKGQNAQIRDLNFYSDDSLNRGSVKLETNFGIINFDVTRQIEDLRENLLR